jgi:hypothetical protein
MNLDRNPTKFKLATLFAACDDKRAHHILWVRNDGEVFVTAVPPESVAGAFAKELKDLRFRYETFAAGNGYVGAEAANNDEYVAEMHGYLVRDRRLGLEGYSDDFRSR